MLCIIIQKQEVEELLKVSILGATGYTGQELVRLLSQHPFVKIVGVGTRSYGGEALAKVYPHLRGLDIQCRNLDDEELIDQADLIFIALPHGLSLPFVEKIINKGKKVIDLGADFRIKDALVYQEWYGCETKEEYLKQAVYGLAEINYEKIKEGSIIANPGCYPTTVLLPLIPLLKNKAIKKESIIVDSKSGVSGAGRKPSLNNQYCETNENLKAYGLPLHRHLPEMEQELSLACGEEVSISFTPHLIPMTRGMLSTIYCYPEEGWTGQKIHNFLKEFYLDKPFIRIVEEGEIPHTKWVAGTNYCDIGLFQNPRTGVITILSAIDNLLKGASGQAIQNMNLIFGFDEKAGFPLWGMYP